MMGKVKVMRRRPCVGPGHGNIRVDDIEGPDRRAPARRCGHPLRGPDERRSSTGASLPPLASCAGVFLGPRGLKVHRFDRHRMDVIGGERRMIEQAVAEMREVAVGIACGGNPLVDLNHVHLSPGKRVGRQCAQHQPGRAAAAERHPKRPRDASAARAASAMTVAALRATASSSG